MKNSEFENVLFKNRTCYYFDDIMKFEDSDLDNFLVDEKSYENIFIFNVSYRTLIGLKPLRIRFHEIDGFIRVYDGTRYLAFFGLKNMMPFTIGLEII